MPTLIAGFDWDKGNRDKCQKHGVSVAEIEDIFRSPHRIMPDIGHSQTETRFLAIGKGAGKRPVFVAFTLRDAIAGKLLRPISARFMHQEEIDHYERTLTSSRK